MRRWLTCLAISLAWATGLLVATPFEHRGTAISASDGDSLRILTDEKQTLTIRLNGIDAPELGQDFGQVAKRHLSDLVFGKSVVVRGEKVDRYGRLVGVVAVDGTDVGLEQLRAGLAWFFRQYASDVPPEARPQYEAAEADARSEQRGLWRQPSAIPPWQFRNPSAAERERPTTGKIIGNRNSMIYHLPSCLDYSRVSGRNRVYFDTAEDAEQAGYRVARNCG